MGEKKNKYYPKKLKKLDQSALYTKVMGLKFLFSKIVGLKCSLVKNYGKLIFLKLLDR